MSKDSDMAAGGSSGLLKDFLLPKTYFCVILLNGRGQKHVSL